MTTHVQPTLIQGVFEFTFSKFEDERGQFSRLFCIKALEQTWGPRKVKQINHSITHQPGALRGLHFQYPPMAEAKLIRCLSGKVWDVAVDLRPSSQTFLKWHCVALSAEANNAVLIPEGCAHGFQVLAPSSELIYFHSEFYDPTKKDGIRWDDPVLNIQWPLPPEEISERDQNHRLIQDIRHDLRFRKMSSLSSVS